MIKNLKNFTLISTTVFLFTACGGGGSTDTFVGTGGASEALDNSQYAWPINANINSSFKNEFSINNNAHININPAWAKTKGAKANGEKIKVAVIDQDFEVTHPDIKDKIIATYNVMNNSTNVSNTNAINDFFSHGTAVASIIASPSLGVAPEVELILINMNFDGNLTVTRMVNAFRKAEELGAKVINCSWGGDGVSQDVKNELARLKANGITVIFSSGNGDESGNGINMDINYDDESEDPSVIGVGATGAFNDVTRYSNYGTNIDVLAPGGGDGFLFTNSSIGILVADLIGSAGFDRQKDSFGTPLRNYSPNNKVDTNYAFTVGTSFSAPHVTGLVALMLAVNPNLSPDDIRRILIQNTSKVTNGFANYQTLTYGGVTGTFDTRRAFGKINAGASVLQAENEL